MNKHARETKTSSNKTLPHAKPHAHLLLEFLTIKECQSKKATVDGNVLRRNHLAIVVANLRRDLDKLSCSHLVLAVLELAQACDDLQLCRRERVLVRSRFGFANIVIDV